MREHGDNFAHERTFVGGDAHPNDRRAVLRAKRVWVPPGCSAEKERGSEKNLNAPRLSEHPPVRRKECQKHFVGS